MVPTGQEISRFPEKVWSEKVRKKQRSPEKIKNEILIRIRDKMSKIKKRVNCKHFLKRYL